MGSSIKTKYELKDGKPVIVRLPEVGFIDDKAGKPVGINKFIGWRPLAAFGNSDGDLEMLQYAREGQRPFLALLLHHDDVEREYDYLTGAEEVMAVATQSPWLVVSIQRDFATLFPYEVGD